MEPVAVRIEVRFGEIFVPFDAIGGAKFVGFGPGAGFDFDQLDIADVILLADEVVTELVQEF